MREFCWSFGLKPKNNKREVTEEEVPASKLSLSKRRASA
jgi:hypothetical protein